MSNTDPCNNTALSSTSLYYGYLEDLAFRKAQVDAGIQKIVFSCLDELVHFVFNNIFYIFYPNYEQFYYEKQVETFHTAGKELPPYAHSLFREGVLFFHRFISSPWTIGSLFPSSGALAKAMTLKITEGVDADTPPRRYLDVGAGTGSFTEAIIAKMRKEDHLDIVEYDENLCKLLQRRFRHHPNVHIHHVSIIDFSPAEKYDVVVTGLPFNSFPAQFVQSAFLKYVELTKSGGSFCYFEYMYLHSIVQFFKRLFCCFESAQNRDDIQKIKLEFGEKIPTEINTVYWNMTPARVVHFNCKSL